MEYRDFKGFFFFFKFSNDFIQWKLISIEYILIDTIFLYFYLSCSTEGLIKWRIK